MGSRMTESDRGALGALFKIIDDDDDNIESDADELCVAMKVLPMIREINPEVDGTHMVGLTSGTTSVVDPSCHPSDVLVVMPSTSKDVLS
jgi:hypothetical protein